MVNRHMNIGIIRFGSMGLNLAKNIISTKHKVRAFEETLTPEEKTSHLTSIIKNKFNYGK